MLQREIWRKAAMILAVPCWIPCTAGFCAPIISEVLGTVDHDGTVVIRGSGFGTRPDYSPDDTSNLNRAWKDFEDAHLQSRGFHFTHNGAYADNWRIVSSGNRAHSNYFGEKFYNTSRLGGLAVTQTGSPVQWYTTFWMNMPPDTQAGKFYRIYGSGEAGNIYLATGGNNRMIRGFSEATGMEPPPTTQWTSPGRFGEDTWHRVEIWMEEDPSRFTVWLDGALQWSQDNWVSSPFGGDGHTWDVGHMIDPPLNNGGVAGSFRFDDIYMDHTRARIELANASVLEDATHREVQLPGIWCDDSIAIRVNAGGFAAGSDVYLYVVDENGAANVAGFPVTLSDVRPVDTIGDMDWDDDVDFDDIAAFVQGIEDQDVYQSRFCSPSWFKGDTDGDADHDFDDVSGFVTLLEPGDVHKAVRVVPEPTSGCLALVGLLGLLTRTRKTPRFLRR